MINFDGTSFGNPRPAGFGIVMPDSQGNVIQVEWGPLGRSDSNCAEVMGQLESLRMIKSRGLHNCVGL